jgi:hypothetical protein
MPDGPWSYGLIRMMPRSWLGRHHQVTGDLHHAGDLHCSWLRLIVVGHHTSLSRPGRAAPGWRPAHYGRFFRIWNEYQKLREQDPSFEPARPVMPAFTQQPYDLDQPQPQPTEPLTREVAGLFNLGYEVVLHVLTRFFPHTDETDEQLDALVGAALGIMTGVLKPLPGIPASRNARRPHVL